MKKKRKLVLLPTTNAENSIIKYRNDSLLHQKSLLTQSYLKEFGKKSFHLYLISDDEIKERDWYIEDLGLPDSTLLHQMDKASYEGWNSTDSKKDNLKRRCAKVIASTDSELKLFQDLYGIPHYLPQFSENFLKAYCKAGGKITEVMVEYSRFCSVGKYPIDQNNWYEALKLRDDNTVIISTVKTNINKESLPKIIKNILDDLNTNQEQLLTDEDIEDYIKTWIVNNL